jgi:hypothetical protein
MEVARAVGGMLTFFNRLGVSFRRNAPPRWRERRP